MAHPAVNTDHSNKVASKWPETNLILSRVSFQIGWMYCFVPDGRRFLAFRYSIKNVESLLNAGKYSLTFSRFHHADCPLKKHKSCSILVNLKELY